MNANHERTIRFLINWHVVDRDHAVLDGLVVRLEQRAGWRRLWDKGSLAKDVCAEREHFVDIVADRGATRRTHRDGKIPALGMVDRSDKRISGWRRASGFDSAAVGKIGAPAP